jgi:hypothetical protein
MTTNREDQMHTERKASYGRAGLTYARRASVLLAALSLVRGPVAASPWAVAASGPALSVNASEGAHAIDPDIYGITWFYNSGGATDANFAAFAKSIRLPISRHGGDATTRYNWMVDSSNAGNDWYFTGGNGQATGTATPSASADHMIAANRATATKQILTVPAIEYINAQSPWHCGFPKADYPAQQAYNPYVPSGGGQCGNGYTSAGAELFGTNPRISDIPNTAAIQTAWVKHLVKTFGTASAGGVAVYEMDNEPTAWGFEHRDVHPSAETCSELVTQTLTYAAAVKAGDPTAAVLGPGDIAPADVFSCNGTTNGQWYLAQMAQYERTHGKRLLDYYSMHYPACCGGDPIANTLAHIKLHHHWINTIYPGTKLGYDEWNDGAPTDFAASLNHADMLGVFGREDVSLASFWGFSSPSDPTAYVWRMYRNYDGKGGAFGETGVAVASADTTKLSCYAAKRASDGAVTIIVINKTAGAITSALSVAGFAEHQGAMVYTYSAANPGEILATPLFKINLARYTHAYPASSVTLIAIR